MKNEIETVSPKSRSAWRTWLQKNHHSAPSVWLVYYKKKSAKPSISYSDAVDEALCFGWIDSKTKTIDDERYMQFFCRRKAGSVWSKVNKAKVRTLIREGRMTPAGLEVIARAKKDGSWTILDEVEALIVPQDLQAALNRSAKAKKYFATLSRSDTRNLLQWLVLAKRQETRDKRIHEIVRCAAQQIKPKILS